MGSVEGEEAIQGPIDREERILVSVRVRPLNDKELSRYDVSDWECVNDTTIIYKNNLSASERSLYPTAYTFDRVFNADCPTRQVYEEAAKEVALSVLSGINSCIFAYGQTSSGKTYTMSGITEYAVADILNYIEKHKERDFVLKFSALEIYNESVRDLLCADSTPLRLLDDPERGTVVERLTEETLRDWNSFTELISFCETQRQIGETSMNEASSRSHQILRLTIESYAREFLGDDTSSSLAASVNFVDLAGSERASQTNSAGTRLKEGSHINRSLLTLGTVIRKLSKGRNGHIPFRDSKLTRILQSSLGGNARTAIICTMSPARIHVEQSRNTLLFASSARDVTTNAQVNAVMSDKVLVKQLQRELARLESKMRDSSSFHCKSDSTEMLKEKELEIEMLKKEISDLTLQRDLAQSQIKDMLQFVGDDVSSSELESLEPQYPKLRVRNSWDSEYQTEEPNLLSFDGSDSKLRVRSSWDFENETEEPNLLSLDSLETKLRVRSSSDFENQSEEPNLLNFDGLESIKSFDASLYSDGHSFSSDDNLFQLSDLEKNLPFISDSPGLSDVRVDAERNDSDQRNFEEQHDKNLGDQVTCIESEDLITNTCTNANLADLNPNLYIDPNASCPGENTAVSGADIDSIDKKKLELPPTGLKKNKILTIFHQDSTLLSPQQIFPLPSEISASSSRMVKFARSISCKASIMRDSSQDWFDQEEIIQSTPQMGIEKDFTERLASFQRRLCTLNYNANAERMSWSGYGNPLGSAAIDLLNVKSANDKESDGNLLTNNEIPETGLQSTSAKQFKDVGLDPLQSDDEKHSDWPSEFKRLQREIVQLWHACNVSLVHRSYFFLLFKGEPSDSIYMEVELRRLSYLKGTFSQGNQVVEEGRTLTPESSIRYLRKERQMLSRRMGRRLTKSERNKLYMKWGIGKSSKHRRLQLAHLLWSDSEDMDNIRESAAIVTKLVGSVEPDQAFKEMFGLNFAVPQRRSKKSFGWTATMKRITS